MDGPRRTAKHHRVSVRWRFRLGGDRWRLPSIAIGICLVCFSQSLPCSAADRPKLFRRPAARKSASKATEPSVDQRPSPSPKVAESSETVDTTVIAASGITKASTHVQSDTQSDTAAVKRFPRRSEATEEAVPNEMPADGEIVPIDLPAALQLAGFRSPEVLIAQQRVLVVTARQQLAAAQALPNLNGGTNYDAHTGVLQQASGAIINVQREALYVGAGLNAVAAGSVNLPGLQYNLNVGETYFNYLISRQETERSWAAATTQRNNTLLQLSTAYCRLVQAQGTRAIRGRIRDEAAEIARITASYAKVGQGRPADAERAATELGRRNADLLAADLEIAEASARIGQILNMESSVQLRSSENWAVPRSITPDLIPLPELIAIALYQRPEMAERRAQVHAAMLELQSARLLLFSPQFIAGFSDGQFGGGSDLNASQTGKSRFGNFDNRTDGDVVLYWSIRNLGLANRSLIKMATAKLAATDFEQTQQLNEIRAEVADAYARTQSRAAQLDIRQQAVITSERSFTADLKRTRAGEGRPIEVLDSLRLVARSQQEYLDTIAEYNQAHYELYVAIGQPPADLLSHPAEVDELPPQPTETK